MTPVEFNVPRVGVGDHSRRIEEALQADEEPLAFEPMNMHAERLRMVRDDWIRSARKQPGRAPLLSDATPVVRSKGCVIIARQQRMGMHGVVAGSIPICHQWLLSL